MPNTANAVEAATATKVFITSSSTNIAYKKDTDNLRKRERVRERERERERRTTDEPRM